MATSDVFLGESAAVALVNVCDLRLVTSRGAPLAVFLALHSSRGAYLSLCLFLIVSISRGGPLAVFLALRSPHCVYLRLVVFISGGVPRATFLVLHMHSSCCIPLAVFIFRCVSLSLNMLVVRSSR